MGLPLGILAIGVGGFLVFGQPPEVPRREQVSRAPLVQTESATSFEGPLTIEVEGVAVPHRQVTVAAEVTGRVTEKAAISRAGSFVSRDDFLIEIDPTDYKLEVARIENELRKAEEDIVAVDVDIANAGELLALAEEDLALRKRELVRRERLLSTSAISESAVDEAGRLELASRNSRQTLINELKSLKQRKATLQAAAELVRVQLQRAQVDLRRSRVVAPLTGTVTREYVEQDDFVTKGEPLVLLSETTLMEIKCSLRVDQLYWLWLQSGKFGSRQASAKAVFEIPNTPVEVTFEFDGCVYSWEGVLSRYEGTGVDVETRMVPCRVAVSDPTTVRTAGESDISLPTLFSGMYVTVRIPVSAPVELIAVPVPALRPGGKIWVVRDGKLVVESVDVALEEPDRVILRGSGVGALAAGDKVVVSPLPHVVTGMTVQEVPSP